MPGGRALADSGIFALRRAVGDEDPQTALGRRHGCTPARYLGTRMLTFVPAPGAVSTTSP